MGKGQLAQAPLCGVLEVQHSRPGRGVDPTDTPKMPGIRFRPSLSEHPRGLVEKTKGESGAKAGGCTVGVG